LGATFALFVNAATTVWSNYLTRRDEHVQEADKCNELAVSLITVMSLARDAAQGAASTLGEPIPPGGASKRFSFPPFDEILHSQDQSLDVIDPDSRSAVLQLEAYYRAIRDDLSHTPDIKAEGETFSLLQNSPNREFYANAMNYLVKVGDFATQRLNKSPHCDDLAKTRAVSQRNES